MKCKNCSANYKARELKCPYCNTTNLLGHIWLSEKTEAELEYEKAKKSTAVYQSMLFTVFRPAFWCLRFW